MTTHTSHPGSDVPLTRVPATIRTFLAAHAARETDAAARTFTPDAVIVDQDETFAGTDRVVDFLAHAGSEFTYTSELVAARRFDDAHWEVVNRIEGDFPGGVAELGYRFTLADDLIRELTIR